MRLEIGKRRIYGYLCGGGVHAGYLFPAELKLISEWLDFGCAILQQSLR